MSRKWLISVSIVGHLAVGVGLFASGIWKLEKLESDHRMAGIGIMVPTMASGGGQQDLPEHKFVKKEKAEKKVVKDVQWDKRIETDDRPKQVATSEVGDGDGEGPGTGKGKGPGDNIDGEPEGEPCAIPPCGGVSQLPEPPKPPDPPIVNVTPTIMQGLRISGDTQIHPSRTVKTQILADGKNKVVGAIKVCIQTSGAIGSVSLLTSTKYPEYDQQLLESARRWHYRPYTVNGTAMRACAAVTFVYSIK